MSPPHPSQHSAWASSRALSTLPVLADQRLSKPSLLLPTSTNPRMDLALLLTQDAPSTSAAAAASAAPKGMSAAQHALIQRMMAKRAGHTAAPAAPPEPKRGPKINMELWRLGEQSACVWRIPLVAERLLDPEPESYEAKAAVQEAEDLCVHDVCWSPEGDRLAALFSIRRTRATPSSDPSTPLGRYITIVRTYSVHDGRICSTVRLHSVRQIRNQGDLDRFRSPRRLGWHPLDDDYNYLHVRKAAETEGLLAKLSPLPPLPSADEFASGTSTVNLMPHQLRMMQMAGSQAAAPAFELPSAIRSAGRGPLAAFPTLPKAGTDIGLVQRGEASGAATKAARSTSSRRRGAHTAALTLDFDARTVLCATCSRTSRITLLLEGSMHLGSFLASPSYGRPRWDPDRLPAVTAEVDGSLGAVHVVFTTDARLADGDDAGPGVQVFVTEAKLSIKQSGKTHPKSAAHLLNQLSRLSHVLGIYAGYALDVVAMVKQIWTKEVQHNVVDEWTKLARELQVKFGCDVRYELLASLLTGKASAAVEMLLLANLTEGVLSRFEQTAFNAFNRLKQMLNMCLRPALERILICLKEWQGLYRYFRLFNFGGASDDLAEREASDSWSSNDHQDCLDGTTQVEADVRDFATDTTQRHDCRQPNQYIRVVQGCLDSCLKLAELIDVESVTVQEFFRYCRYEKERQERIKQDQQDPRLPINFDVLTVSQFIERGFAPHEIRAFLGLVTAAEQEARVDTATAGIAFVDDDDDSDDDDGPDSDDGEGDDGNGDEGVDKTGGGTARNGIVQASPLDAVLAKARAHLQGSENATTTAQGLGGTGTLDKASAVDPPRAPTLDGKNDAILSDPGVSSSAPPPAATASSAAPQSQTPPPPGLPERLTGVVTQMGETLRDILAESLDHTQLRDLGVYSLGPPVHEGGSTEMTRLASVETLQSRAVAESLVDAQTLATPGPTVPRTAVVSGSDRYYSKTLDEYFIALGARARFEGGDGGISEVNQLLLFSWTPRMWKVGPAYHVHHDWANTSAHTFAGQARSTVVLDVAFYSRKEAVLLLKLPGDVDGDADEQRQQRNARKRKAPVHGSGASGDGDGDDFGARYLVATVHHAEACGEVPGKAEQRAIPLRLHRVAELDEGFEAACMSVNRGKQTVAILNVQRNRLVYLDLTPEGDEEILTDEEGIGQLD
ncbi:hypothetical protein ACQY0O_002575 [Thecaphora frezii]